MILKPHGLALIFGTFFALPAFGQKVSKTLPDKGWVFSTFSNTADIKAGEFACFVDDAGTTVACGKILKVSTTVLVVKVTPPSAAAQVKVGFKTEVSKTPPAGLTNGAGETTAVASKGKKRKAAGAHALKMISSPGLGVFSIAKVGYVPPALGASGVSLWESTKDTISVEKISAALEFDGGSLGRVGLRYALYGDNQFKFVSKMVLQTDYDTTNREKFVEIAHSVTAFGAYYDYPIKRPVPGMGGLDLSAGLDLLSTTAKIDATLHDDADSSSLSLAAIDSKLTVISLRGGAEYAYYFGRSFEIGIGLRALFPVAELSLKQTVTISDGNSSKSQNESEDLMKALDHKKASFGLQIPAFIAMRF